MNTENLGIEIFTIEYAYRLGYGYTTDVNPYDKESHLELWNAYEKGKYDANDWTAF